MGSHHQKLVVVRHRDRPADDVAFIGGIDLCHSRRDDARHLGDPQTQPMSAVYGPRPPWHDIQLELRGPAVGQAEEVFRERWTDPAPLSRNPVHLVGERLLGQDRSARPLPPRRPDPAPVGSHSVQLLRTYPVRHPGYPFAPAGDRSVAHAYRKVLSRARSLVYLEDQYLWSSDVARVFADALAASPDLRMIAVIPGFPDQDGRTSLPPNLVGREKAMSILAEAAGDRFAVYSLENEHGTPIYVHAKVCIVDDSWACVGSDNTNRRSWTHDSELSAAVVDADGAWAKALRLELAAEHLGVSAPRRGPASHVRGVRRQCAPPRHVAQDVPRGSGRPDSCARTSPLASPASPGRGRRRCTGCSTTPTVALRCSASAGATRRCRSRQGPLTPIEVIPSLTRYEW